MIEIVVPVFLVILVGFLFGKKSRFGPEAEKPINDYVLYIALPALLFLAVARADPNDLAQWRFVAATIAGIYAAYLAGIVLAALRGVRLPDASLVGMASCYGTTGYMGIPMLIAAFGQQAAVPAAVATILHNIPAIMTVIVTHDVATQKGSGLAAIVGRAFATTLRNPLTLAVILGSAFSLLHLSLPPVIATFAQFLASAAGPTALFALGLGLARIPISGRTVAAKAGWIAPVVALKVLLQPLVTTAAILVLMGRSFDIWAASAIVMAAQPIGAGAYVFARKYAHFAEETSIAIIVSLCVTVLTLMAVISWVGARLAA